MPLPASSGSEGVGIHVYEMEILLHRTQCMWDDRRGDHIAVTGENRDLLGELDDLRIEHDTIVARNRALTRQLRTTCLARDRLANKIEAVKTANTILRGQLKTAREELATRDSTIEELEEENTDLRKENEDLLPDDDIPSDGDGMDWSDSSDQDDDDLLGDADEDTEEVMFEVNDGQD